MWAFFYSNRSLYDFVDPAHFSIVRVSSFTSAPRLNGRHAIIIGYSAKTVLYSEP